MGFFRRKSKTKTKTKQQKQRTQQEKATARAPSGETEMPEISTLSVKAPTTTVVVEETVTQVAPPFVKTDDDALIVDERKTDTIPTPFQENEDDVPAVEERDQCVDDTWKQDEYPTGFAEGPYDDGRENVSDDGDCLLNRYDTNGSVDDAELQAFAKVAAVGDVETEKNPDAVSMTGADIREESDEKKKDLGFSISCGEMFPGRLFTYA